MTKHCSLAYDKENNFHQLVWSFNKNTPQINAMLLVFQYLLKNSVIVLCFFARIALSVHVM